MSSEIPPIANRRPLPRKRSFLGCMIVYGDGAYSIPCTIRDISPSGAHITYETASNLPARFWLINLRDRTAHKTRMAWSTATEAGVEFESGMPLHQLPPELAYLKRSALRGNF